ncbi:hypothetical protein ST201phi2-1p041 [Pseudomonas phage 201phi2-1]|uniref:Uncharacterized protein n=1 Tax=Pseudomonas phage 201phi2-1 TaxID=198110 RepID=B3FK16_BP201|nr:hypothetical protein ST201phi2-1p041 [Pseudomonas phage 201phi2-1]ABY62874.1 hypothetical protein 201phi2-1p041 [Pseudomonas phage 201phi2-1]
MGNATIFANAFRECGIGGKFSKFQIVQSNDWFELMDIDSLEDSRFCFRVYDGLDPRKFRQVTSGVAANLHKQDPQWHTHFQTAQKVVAKIVSRDPKHGENRYYIDDLNGSVIVINRMFVIEVTPVLRQVPEIPTNAVLEFLSLYSKTDITEANKIKVFSRYGQVMVCVDGCQQFNSLLTEEDFNEQYCEA